MNSTEQEVISKFSQYHYYSNYQRKQYNSAYANWFQSKVDLGEWSLFTCTVVFKPIDIHNHQSRFEDAYKSRFLHKIRRRLDRSKSKHASSIPFDHFYYFEREHKTLRRSFSKKSPFHIHSIIPIKTHQVHRFWSYENNTLNPRIEKDLLSIDIVGDVLIEPVRDTGSFPWLMYITKQKSI